MDFPGRDPKAVRHVGPGGPAKTPESRSVIVVGGGIAGLAAATILCERGVDVTLLESTAQLGGRVAAWEIDPLQDAVDQDLPGLTMSRGFHAFFRQYYNLRNLLRRVSPDLNLLREVSDYPLIRPDGVTDSFTNLPKTPPWSILGFVWSSPTFSISSLSKVDIAAALELIRVKFPETFDNYEGESASAFLDRLKFPQAARDLALEVFARSFFADPTEFSAAELIAMFHGYFLGSAEGLIFDVPVDDYDSCLWAPLGRYLTDRGADVRVETSVTSISMGAPGSLSRVETTGGAFTADAVVLAADPRAARELIAGLDGVDLAATRLAEDSGALGWGERVAETRNAPPFVVVRHWYDGRIDAERPAFVGTSGFGPLDNISALERFEAGASRWATETGGSVIELHGYAAPEAVATDPEALESFCAELVDELHRAYPETAAMGILHEETLVYDDCALVDAERAWRNRPGIQTPHPQLMLAGDWVRCDYPVALMERATTTGMLAANQLLLGWGIAGEDLWTVPMRGLLAKS